jgi:hypothetical protein
MSSLVSLIRRPVDYSEHENWRFIVSAMNALNETPDRDNEQENSSFCQSSCLSTEI